MIRVVHAPPLELVALVALVALLADPADPVELAELVEIALDPPAPPLPDELADEGRGPVVEDVALLPPTPLAA